jgi:hypothetical protein
MSIDRSKLPPQLQELLKSLEANGTKVEILSATELGKASEASSPPSDKKDDCNCPACSVRRALMSGQGIPPLVATLDRMAESMAQRLADRVKEMVEPIRTELQRQVEINDNNMERLANYLERIQGLEARILLLEESHRKQVGLLHRRVTKRKGEIKETKARVASTRGRVTRVEKKLD